MKKLLILGTFVALTVFANAQNIHFYGLLPALNQTGRIGNKLNYNLFASTTIDALKLIENGKTYPATDFQLYLQPSLIYVHSPNLNFAGSYTYQRNNPFNPAYSNEHRLWQQAIFSFAAGNARVTNRFRFEERFIQNRTTGEYPLSYRARYQISFNRPLQGKTLDPKEFYVNAYNEFYFSLTKSQRNALYSENWTYAGLGYNLGKMGRIELGYLFQTFVTKTQDLRFLNLAQVMWITNFNFTKR